MNENEIYDLIIIGGGIASCVFAANHIKKGFIGKIAIVEAGLKLGGRSSTRNSRFHEGFELNHGSPNFNITNVSNKKLLNNFIDDLLAANIIFEDTSDIKEIDVDNNFNSVVNQEFYKGKKYTPKINMTKLSEDIIAVYNAKKQIDFHFGELIIDLKFEKNQWILKSNKGKNYFSKYIILSSNLLIHKRSLDILNINEIPLGEQSPLTVIKT